MNQENNNLIEEILSSLKQEVDLCKKYVIDGNTSIDNLRNKSQLSEAIHIYNMIREVVYMNTEKLKQIKEKRNLTLTEAILHARHVQYCSDLCDSCKAEHGQLADWLEELRNFRRKAMEDEILNPKPIDSEEKV